MRKIVSFFSLFLLCVFPVLADIVEEFGDEETGGIYYIPEIDGKLDLDNIRIEYYCGDVFHGKGTEDGFPIEGELINTRKNVYYYGSFENEEYHGKGSLETEEDSYVGTFNYGKKEGKGVLINKKTKIVYEGDFRNDQKNGDGYEYSKETNYQYKGSFKNDLKDGQGEFINEDGVYYSGIFEKGYFTYGTQIISSGEIFKGRWKKDYNKNGEVQYVPNGDDFSYIGKLDSFYGDIVDGLFEGSGKFEWSDKYGKYSYDGEFIGNQLSGIGQLVYPEGSVYEGQFFENQRNIEGTFDFSNGYHYQGEFLNNAFYKTGILSKEVDGDFLVCASDQWDGEIQKLPNDRELLTDDEENYCASINLPKFGKLLFSNGDMWEGCMNNGTPIAGLGIWTTQEERLAKIEKNAADVYLCSYSLNSVSYDISSVYSDQEVLEIISSETYLASWNDSYKKHKDTIDKFVSGLQTVATVLSIIPSPIQPIAFGIDLALSGVQIVLKTASTATDIYNCAVSGTSEMIPGLMKEWGKDVAWDAINIILATPGSGKVIGKVFEKGAAGFGKAAEKIGKVTSKVIAKNQTVAHIASHLGQVTKVGKHTLKTWVEVTTRSDFYKWVARTGGKITRGVKVGWISKVYPQLFKKYGDDVVELLCRHGNGIVKQLEKNGDLIISASKSAMAKYGAKKGARYSDDIIRLFTKNGDEIAKVARASEYPDAVIRYIQNSNNIDDAVKFAAKNKNLGKIVNKYGDDAIKCVEKYGDGALKVLEKNGDQFTKALMKLPAEKHYAAFNFFSKYSDEASILYAKYQESIIDIFEKAGPMRQDKLLQIVKKEGDSTVALLASTPKAKLRKSLDILSEAPDAEFQKALKYIEKTKSGRVVGDAQQDFVYRVIRSDENPALGLSAKNPNRGMSIDGHVRTGSRNNGSQYISTTTDINVAKKWAEADGCKIVKIDLNKINDTVDIYDLSIKEGQELFLKGLTQNFANASKEVLIKGYIPPSALLIL